MNNKIRGIILMLPMTITIILTLRYLYLSDIILFYTMIQLFGMLFGFMILGILSFIGVKELVK